MTLSFNLDGICLMVISLVFIPYQWNCLANKQFDRPKIWFNDMQQFKIWMKKIWMNEINSTADIKCVVKLNEPYFKCPKSRTRILCIICGQLYMKYTEFYHWIKCKHHGDEIVPNCFRLRFLQNLPNFHFELIWI